jgi:hypothetical protein
MHLPPFPALIVLKGQFAAALKALIPLLRPLCPPVYARGIEKNSAISSTARTILIEAPPYIYWPLPIRVEGLHSMPSQSEALTEYAVARFLLLTTFPA